MNRAQFFCHRTWRTRKVLIPLNKISAHLLRRPGASAGSMLVHFEKLRALRRFDLSRG